MKLTINQFIIAFLKTILFFILTEIIFTTILPILGIHQFKPSINILIILFLAFKLNISLVPYLILVVQLIHSAFSIEGWAMGTLIGMIILVLVRYAKDMISFSSPLTTSIIVLVFHIIWYLFFTVLAGLKMSDYSVFYSWFFSGVLEGIIIALISPQLFKVLDRFWYLKKSSDEVSF